MGPRFCKDLVTPPTALGPLRSLMQRSVPALAVIRCRNSSLFSRCKTV